MKCIATFGTTFAICLLTCNCVSAFQTTLWDQQPIPPLGFGVADQVAPDMPDFSTFIVSDVVFDSAVNVESITTYFTNSINGGGSGLWPQGGQGTAVLNIFADDGALDLEDPFTGNSVTVDFFADGENGIEVTASGLDLNLLAGTYWIGLTPELSLQDFGQEFHQYARQIVGADSRLINPGGFIGDGQWQSFSNLGAGLEDSDMALTVRGTPVPEPSFPFAILVGSIAAIGYRRRSPVLQ